MSLTLEQIRGNSHKSAGSMDLTKSEYDECQKRIADLETNKDADYWRDKVDFLKQYIANGIESKLLRYALSYLGIEPLSVLKGLNAFYDSGAYVCSDKSISRIAIDNKQRYNIKTFNIDDYKVQFPVPNKDGKFDNHVLAAYDCRNNTRLLFTLNPDETVDVIKYHL